MRLGRLLIIFFVLISTATSQVNVGAIAQPPASNERLTRSVLDFGAKCDGKSDDRPAIQRAIDSVAGGTLTLPSSACAVSAPGIYLYPANSGMTLTGNTASTNFNGGGGGLIALPSSAPEVILTLYAQNIRLNNLLVDCNRGAADTGIVAVFGLASVWTNVSTRNCSGDGAQAFTYRTPPVSIISGGRAGSNSVTVASITNNRLTFGSQTCSEIMFDFDTANEELFAISSVSGNSIKISGVLKHDHEKARCAGNNNSMHIVHYSSFGNKGWGWRVFHSDNNNDFWWADGSSTSNLLGGELWSGASHKHFGGSYQGDGGPAIQLGAFATSPDSASATTAYMTITPPGDLEGNGFNGVSVMCDNHSEVMFVDPATLEIMTGSKSCHRAGSNTQGLGTSPSLPGFILKMSSGDGRPNWVLPVGVNSVLLQEGKEAGITCFNPSNAGAGTPSCLMRLDGTDSSGARVPYAGISSQIGDNTTSSQKGSLHLQYVTGGKLTDGMTVDDDGGVTIPAYKGAKAPVCIDATGRLYRGNDTGKGIPCP